MPEEFLHCAVSMNAEHGRLFCMDHPSPALTHVSLEAKGCRPFRPQPRFYLCVLRVLRGERFSCKPSIFPTHI